MTTIIADRVDATVLDAALEDHPYFSWGAVFAGAAAAVAVTAMVLALGAGFGLVMVGPATGAKSALTAAAIYAFAAQAFGFAVGGFIAGRLCGPVLQSREEEMFRSGAHGLVVWAISAIAAGLILILATIAAAGATAGIASAFNAPQSTASKSGVAPTDYWVDMLFRAPEGSRAHAPNGDARAEANRILAVNALKAAPMEGDDYARLGQLVAAQTGIARADANRQVDSVLARMHDDLAKAAETARKAAAYASIWSALALLFGLLVATAAAVLARMEDEKKGA